MLKNVLNALKSFLRLHMPISLPQSEAEVIEFAKDVCALGGFPYNDSFLHSIATQIMHQDSMATKVSRRQFIVAIRRAIANQAAFGVIEDTKQRQREQKLTGEAIRA